nr:protein ALP1-like [Leptinotarsa decemlineata]
MSAVEVQFIINSVGPKIIKQDTTMRLAIPVYGRIMVTLRFLASGDSYSSLQYLFRIPVCTIGTIVKEVTLAIYEILKEPYLKFPNTKNEWLSTANSFDSRWNFPHCVGAVDGKHVSIQNPHNSGSHYFNYKGTYSIVLLAVADANYNLIYFDIGCNGRISDGEVFQNCSLSHGLEDGSIELLVPSPLPGRDKPVLFCFVADDAFPMKPYILKPYPFQNQPAPNRIINYRLSRARRIIENVFGIMANKF